MSNRLAVGVGYLVGAGPLILIAVLVYFVAQSMNQNLIFANLALILVSPFWWRLVIPRWRRWALSRGAVPEELDRAARRAFLTRGPVRENRQI